MAGTEELPPPSSSVGRGMSRRTSGSQAEEQVARWLITRAWQVLGRNVRGPGFELDIIARKGRTLLVVEVKRVASLARISVEDLVPRRKRQALVRGTRCIAGNDRFTGPDSEPWETWRIDLAVVEWPEGQPPEVRWFVNCVECD